MCTITPQPIRKKKQYGNIHDRYVDQGTIFTGKDKQNWRRDYGTDK